MAPLPGGIDRQTVAYRLKKGMALQDALTAPRRRYPKNTTRGAGRTSPAAPAKPPSSEPAQTSWHKAMEEATNVRLAAGPITDDAAEIISELLSVFGEHATTPTRQRLLARGRAWLLRVGWQR